MISGFSDVPFFPKPTTFIFGYFKIKQIPKHVRNLFVGKFQNVGKPFLKICGKDGGWKIPTIRPTNSWKSWIQDQYLPENMRWEFGKSLEPRSFEIKQLYDQETKKL